MEKYGDELFKKGTKTKDPDDWVDAIYQRQKTNYVIKPAKRDFFRDKIQNSKVDPKKFWGNVSCLLPRKTGKTDSIDSVSDELLSGTRGLCQGNRNDTRVNRHVPAKLCI